MPEVGVRFEKVCAVSLVVVVVMLLMGLLAYQRGFNPFAWIFAGGCLGVVVLFFLPSAKEAGLDAESRDERRRRGNLFGIGLTAVAMTVGIAAFVVEVVNILSA
ncbi:hypothetical protein ACTWPB_15190 [Nocardia sp. IBHARD005]|uniref:hypothetical protein n=1 Tax=Nocardia sp. IBHARD005 TaxID=3457765 RepID=UPI004059F568